MLQLQVIRDQSQRVLAGLNKRNFKDAESLINNVINTDQTRRQLQARLDTIKAESNSKSKKIGELMKSGNNDEATTLRTSVAADKDVIKDLEGQLTALESDLQQLLYRIPNVPAEKVPAGK